MSTQEKLRRAMMTGPNRWAEATINGKLVSYYEIHDETILLDLIESAKREELESLPFAHDTMGFCEHFGKQFRPCAKCVVDKRLAELKQSEESE